MKLLSNARFNRIRKIIKIFIAMLLLTFLFVEGLIFSGFSEQTPGGLDYIIVSGGQGIDEPISEAQAMYDYLVEYAIDSKRIKKEAQSTSTVENFQFSYELLESPENSVGIVTSNFHVFRSMKLGKTQGFQEIYGIPSSSDAERAIGTEVFYQKMN